MNFSRLGMAVLATVLAVWGMAVELTAQQQVQPRPRFSPHETISQVIDGARVTVTYGRPYTNDPKTGEPREIWGKVVPYGKVWRAGADEATTLITQKPLVVEGATLPAGVYSLFFLPEQNGTSKLVVNRQYGHWGTQYDASQDLVRIDAAKETLTTPLDQFQISLLKKEGGGGVIRLAWASLQFSVPFSVQN
ncbi:MAG TPA: DUF2911 domain-containing protein [Opitutaceae bacterium]|nr:DUF2911 domain-containing protein [Opitutaceae bacterium]